MHCKVASHLVSASNTDDFRCDGAGNVTAAQLYAPYGGARYSSGTMPTAKGFTGQRADAATGLDYYGARYYDPVAGQFTSADTVADGLSPYAYVRGNPETLTDPTGHMYTRPHGGGGDPSSPPSDPGSKPGSGKGKGHGGDGSKNPCVTDPGSDACHEQERDHYLQGLHNQGALLIAIGYIVIGALALAIAFNPTADIVSKLQAIITFVTAIGDAFSYLPTSIRDQAGFTEFEAILHGLAAVANRGLLLLDQYGVFAKAGVTAATDAAEAAAGSEVSLGMMIFQGIISAAGSTFITTAGQLTIAAGFRDITDYNNQEGEDIGAWCADHRSVCTSA